MNYLQSLPENLCAVVIAAMKHIERRLLIDPVYAVVKRAYLDQLRAGASLTDAHLAARAAGEAAGKQHKLPQLHGDYAATDIHTYIVEKLTEAGATPAQIHPNRRIPPRLVIA